MPIVPDFDTKNLNILPEYDGNPNELQNFIQGTTLLLNHYWNAADAGCFQNRISTQGIISKLKGRAKEVVPIYSCSNWPSIKDVLIQNFVDQWNENSLTRDLVHLQQGSNEAPQQFYEKVMGLLNTISNYVVELYNYTDKKELSYIFIFNPPLKLFIDTGATKSFLNPDIAFKYYKNNI